MTTESSAGVEELLSHESWLRGILRALVAPDDVEDAVQRAWLVALSRPPAKILALRAWLGGVARNIARNTHREHERRGKVLDRARTPATEQTPEQALLRLELQREVVAAVVALPALYREAIIRRFYWQHSFAAIAAALECSEEVVRQRVSRGLARLRGTMERSHGSDWRAYGPLVVIAGLRGTATGLRLAVALLLLIGTTAMLWTLSLGSPSALPEGHQNAAATEDSASRSESTPTAAAPLVVADELQRSSVDTAAPEDRSAVSRLVGRVVDRRGYAMANVAVGVGYLVDRDHGNEQIANAFVMPSEGLATIRGLPRNARADDDVHWPDNDRVELDGFEQLARTDAAGRFEIVDPPWGYHLLVGEHTAPLASFPIAEGGRDWRTAVLVAEPAVHIAGVVVDAKGQPIPGVQVDGDAGELVDLSVDWQRSTPVHYEAVLTDEHGRFALPCLPGNSMKLRFSHVGYAIQHREVPSQSTATWVVTLPEETVRTIYGVVRDASYRVVPHAYVGYGSGGTWCDAAGAYQLELKPTDEAQLSCYALATGWQPVTATIAANGAANWDPQLSLRTVPLKGRVVDENGRGVSGLLASVWQPTELGKWKLAEELAAATPSEGGSMSWVMTSTDKEGRFVFGQMMPRGYEIVFYEQKTGKVVRSSMLMPGAQRHVVQWQPQVVAVRGVVVDAAGRPAEGANVRYARAVTANSMREFSVSLGPTRADGLIEATQPPDWCDARFLISGEGWATTIVSWQAAMTPKGLQIPAFRKRTFRLELSGPRRQATSFRLLDAAGQEVQISRMRGSSGSLSTERDLVDGRTEVLTTGGHAVEVQLLRDGLEIERFTIRLDQEGVMVVRG